MNDERDRKKEKNYNAKFGNKFENDSSQILPDKHSSKSNELPNGSDNEPFSKSLEIGSKLRRASLRKSSSKRGISEWTFDNNVSEFVGLAGTMPYGLTGGGRPIVEFCG